MVIAAFTTRLRLTVDLDEVQGDLVGAVDTAFQPAHVSVCLPPRLRPGVAAVNAASTPIAARTQANSLGGAQGSWREHHDPFG